MRPGVQGGRAERGRVVAGLGGRLAQSGEARDGQGLAGLVELAQLRQVALREILAAAAGVVDGPAEVDAADQEVHGDRLDIGGIAVLALLVAGAGEPGDVRVAGAVDDDVGRDLVAVIGFDAGDAPVACAGRP